MRTLKNGAGTESKIPKCTRRQGPNHGVRILEGIAQCGNYILAYQVTVVDGRDTFYAYKTLSWRWERPPKLTENTNVKYEVDGSHLVFMDEAGKEVKADDRQEATKHSRRTIGRMQELSH